MPLLYHKGEPAIAKTLLKWVAGAVAAVVATVATGTIAAGAVAVVTVITGCNVGAALL